ncbi:MAG: NTP transferase domain-containing protein [Verrucomicrobia bacterium]|nr:NTP transferase domain-containing protein [Verrucomicrobiota bacterium]
MKAFIYAAGIAVRLGPIAQTTPKILLEFGGRSLLEWHVLRLTAAGVDQIRVITGHLREPVSKAIHALKGRHAADVREIFNPDFQEGSVLSMAVSVPEAELCDPFALLMDGDVLYDSRMLPRLIGSPHPTALLIDRGYSAADDDPVLVPIMRGRPVDFAKRWRGEADQVGESVGFFKVSAADMVELAQDVRSRSRGEGRMDSYHDVIRAMTLKGLFAHEDATGLPWIEIDFPQDAAQARDRVMPLILRSND